MRRRLARLVTTVPLILTLATSDGSGQDAVGRDLSFPPRLPDGKSVVTDTSPKFLEPPATLQEGVAVAEEVPTVDFLFYPGQDYVGNPWSNWGEGVAFDGKYYSAIGDHLGFRGGEDEPDHLGNAFVYEYDSRTETIRQLVDLQKVLDVPPGHYTPGKVHTGMGRGRDGWLYYATHRGSTRATTPEFHYEGDWILRTNPKSGETEIVAHGPVPGHSIPAGVLDSKRMIFYGGTRSGGLRRGVKKKPGDERLLAYDVVGKQVLFSGPKSSAFGLALAESTGRLYYLREQNGEDVLTRFDPETGNAETIPGDPRFIGHATPETDDGYVYSASFDRTGEKTGIWSLNTATEEIAYLGPAHVGEKPELIASIAVGPHGRYLYYTPDAHGGAEETGTPIVQFDTKTKRRKVIAFLHPFYRDRYGCTLRGTYGVAIDPAGDKLYTTWNVSRTSRVWDCCAATVVHIPESERRP